MRTSCAERGFTLLEMLVVLALVALIGSLGIASLQPVRQASVLQSEARALALWLEQQRGRSLTGHAPRVVQVTPAPDGRSRVTGDDRNVRLTALLPTEQAQAITFYPDGGSSGATLALTGGARTATVTVDAITGRIAVLQP